MKINPIISIIFVVILSGLVLFFLQDEIKRTVDIIKPYTEIGFSKISDIAQERRFGEVNISGPLRDIRPGVDKGSLLDGSNIVALTNIERGSRGIHALEENVKLNEAAFIKMEDMFERQYFAHYDSFGNMGASYISGMVNYEYIAIGENLALGNFLDDQDIVKAWMESPGHRANILNDRYTEIGVAVSRRNFEGGEVWIGVQIFGRPLSDCPSVDEYLSVLIDENKEELLRLEKLLLEKQEEIDNTRPKRGEEYNRKVEEYNELAAQYNDLIEETEGLISEYNRQVGVFNECANL